MKQLSQLCFLLLFCWASNAQATEIILHFNYTFGGDPLVKNEWYDAGGGLDVSFQEVKFICSDLRVNHDAGAPITFSPSNNSGYAYGKMGLTEYNLGDHSYGNITSLDFVFGIDDSATNHGDPTGMGHPLTLQNAFGENMHWGWAAGYKFFILSGSYDFNSDGVADGTFEMHGVGDAYLKNLNLPISAETMGGKDVFFVEADVEGFFDGLNYSSIGTKHGGTWTDPSHPITIAFENVGAGKVFFANSSSVGLGESDKEMELVVSPNPSANGFHINLNPFPNAKYVRVYNPLGKLVYENESAKMGQETFIPSKQLGPGYFLLIVSDGRIEKSVLLHSL